MKIKLVRKGGIIPVTKAAETEVSLTDEELSSLIEIIRAGPPDPRVRDATFYELVAGDISAKIDPEKAPGNYKPLFEKLKSELKFIK
jgi:hypothetical protein